MFTEFDNSSQLCSSKGFKYFSLSLPFPSIIFAFTGLHLAYHNKQIFKYDADTGHERVLKLYFKRLIPKRDTSKSDLSIFIINFTILNFV